MGFFSKKKKEEKKSENKSDGFVPRMKELENKACPCCQRNTFTIVNYFDYFEDMEGAGSKESPVVNVRFFDVSRWLGQNTGYCDSCGGIVKGVIYTAVTEKNKDLLNVISMKNCQSFYLALMKINEEKKNGPEGDQMRLDFSDLLLEYKNAFEHIYEVSNVMDFIKIALGIATQSSAVEKVDSVSSWNALKP